MKGAQSDAAWPWAPCRVPLCSPGFGHTCARACAHARVRANPNGTPTLSFKPDTAQKHETLPLPRSTGCSTHLAHVGSSRAPGASGWKRAHSKEKRKEVAPSCAAILMSVSYLRIEGRVHKLCALRATKAALTLRSPIHPAHISQKSAAFENAAACLRWPR